MTLSEGLSRMRIWLIAIGLGLGLTTLISFVEQQCWHVRSCAFNRRVAEQVMMQVDALVSEARDAASYQSTLKKAIKLLSAGAEERPVYLTLRTMKDSESIARSDLQIGSELLNDESGLFQYRKIFHEEYEVKVMIQTEPWKFLGLPQLWMNDLALVLMFLIFTLSGVGHVNRHFSGRKRPTPEGGGSISSA